MLACPHAPAMCVSALLCRTHAMRVHPWWAPASCARNSYSADSRVEQGFPFSCRLPHAPDWQVVQDFQQATDWRQALNKGRTKGDGIGL